MTDNAQAWAYDDALERVWVARQVALLTDQPLDLDALEVVEVEQAVELDLEAGHDPHRTAPFDVEALVARLEADLEPILRRRWRWLWLLLAVLPGLVLLAVLVTWVAGTWHGALWPW